MSEEWRNSDPFVDPDDPEALAREQRRRDREERRRRREEKRGSAKAVAPPPPPLPEAPPGPARTPDEDFWDEDPGEAPPPPPEVPPAPPGSGSGRFDFGGRRRIVMAALALLAVAGAAVAAIASLSGDEAPPPPRLKTVTVTIPEGYSRSQTAELAEELGLKGDYTKASVRSRYLNPAKYGGKHAENLEGFLFPDTFELKAGAPVGDLVQLQLEDFKRRLAGIDLRYARSKNLTVYDVVTIASMVEREAMLDRERPLIAAVIYNRLREGIPLGIDATVRFATGNLSEPLTESELEVDSPYNTRVNAGLPPGPIGSPGLASIEAAAHPAKADYLYYVVKPGTCGEHSFSSSDVEFQADVARYNEAREEAGGKSPDTCG